MTLLKQAHKFIIDDLEERINIESKLKTTNIQQVQRLTTELEQTHQRYQQKLLKYEQEKQLLEHHLKKISRFI